MANIAKWSFRDGNRIARTVGRFLRDRTTYSTDEFIHAAEKAAQRYPDEWIVFYALGDKYMEKGEYARALQACKRCVELRPNDIRSPYALATSYNVLVRADWAEFEAEIADALREAISPVGDPLDPNISDAELQEMGMVVETAATQAMRWFERALELKPDASSRAQIKEDLSALYKRFPHLRH